MRFNNKQKSLSSLLFAGLFATSAHAQSNLNLQPTFQNDGGKNIVFFSTIGGASHYNWVLNIGDELGSRGHNVTFLTSDEDMRFGSPYKHVQTVSTGPGTEWDPAELFTDELKEISTNRPGEFMAMVFDLMFNNYERDYLFTRQFFIDNKIDVALCDHFADACVDVATNLSIPYIVTAAMDVTKDTAAPYINNDIATLNFPTTEYQPFIKPQSCFACYQKMNARKIAIGFDAKLEDPSTKWQHSIKLSNTVFGYTPARPLGPMAEFVGPIIPKHYKPLTPDLEAYLNAHERVAYVAFGHAATPSEKDIVLILSGLLESIERGDLDGFVWATVHAAGRFPDSITTSSGHVYSVKDMFDHVNPHAHMVKWAPQTAILHHPSTALFVTHGGLGSWYESMYSGTRLVVFPFFGDQHGNGFTVEVNKLGGVLKNEYSVQEAVDLFRKVLVDETGEIADGVKRMQALTQIYSRHGVIRGADIVEEVAYTNKNGRLPHRESADHRMSYIKSHNLDLYGALALLVSFALLVVAFIAQTGYRLIFKPSSTDKIKKL
ncbi:hypothetical protein V8B55DRAFT_1498356 [Mucor lusitanicus]